MNERIRELMIRSNPHGDFSDSEWVFEKFAELIVKECVFISRTSTDGFTAGRRMEQHFGVEE